MPIRNAPLVNHEIYHIYNKSIAGFKIFNTTTDYNRMLSELDFYSLENPPCKFSEYENMKIILPSDYFDISDNLTKLVEILAFCIMPTHIHLILKQLIEGGISEFMQKILLSYSKYFNLKHNRKGPLWESRFKNILVNTDEQFLHLTRYIHLNPVTAHLVEKPEDWQYSSYAEYLTRTNHKNLCNDYSRHLNMNIAAYKKFVNDHIGYQRELAQIKHLALE